MHSNIVNVYIHSQKYSLTFSGANLFGYSLVIFLTCQIYLDIHSSNIYGNKYMPMSMWYLGKIQWYLRANTGVFGAITVVFETNTVIFRILVFGTDTVVFGTDTVVFGKI